MILYSVYNISGRCQKMCPSTPRPRRPERNIDIYGARGRASFTKSFKY